jgi:hypothetical protein
MDQEDLSDDKSIDSDINDQSFQSKMSISDIDEIDQNTEKTDQNENIIENILEDSNLELNEEKFKSEINTKYPNEAYGDLMSLVTKQKLSNVMGNAIIKFFNKHANLDKSPLPRSIEQGRKYMDNMNLPSLKYTKTCVMKYNDNEYYLYYQSLINCIKNILSISDVSQNFALAFEKVEVIVLHFQPTIQFDIY